MGPGNPSGSVTDDLSHCGVGSHSFSSASWSTNCFSRKAVTVYSQINHTQAVDLCVHSAGVSYIMRPVGHRHIISALKIWPWLSQIYCSCAVSWCAQIKNYFLVSQMKFRIDTSRIYIFISECQTYLFRAVLDFTSGLWLISSSQNSM